MADTLNITIRIAGQEPFPLNIERAHEENARKAEYHVNLLFSKLSQTDRHMPTSRVLAMVAYRFAELLFTQDETVRTAETVIDDFDAALDEILLDMPQEKDSQA